MLEPWRQQVEARGWADERLRVMVLQAVALQAHAIGRRQCNCSWTRSRAPLIEALSRRELEVLRLITQGLSNHEIGERLFLALDTVKGHNRKIFGKLQVQRRTEAVARARELGLS